MAIDIRFFKVSFEPYFRPHKIRLAVLAGFPPRLVCETYMLRRSNAEQSYPAEPGDVKGAGIQDAGDNVNVTATGIYFIGAGVPPTNCVTQKVP